VAWLHSPAHRDLLLH